MITKTQRQSAQQVGAEARRRLTWRKARGSLGAMAAFIAAGCSPSVFLNELSPREGYDVLRSVPYGDGPRRTLDVYQPANANGAPVVVFFYGGSWQGGSKESYLFVAAALARSGFITIVPDYRVYPEVKFPAFVEDGALAVGWARKNASRFGGDPDKIVLMGHSAGAHIAAMLSIDGRWLADVGLDSSRDIAGLVGLAGPYDFLPIRNKTLQKVFGGKGRPETQPISFVNGGEPPSLLFTGPRDRTVYPGNTTRLATRLRAAGSEARVMVPPRVGHLTIVGAFAWPLRFLDPVLEETVAFVREVSASPRQPLGRTGEGP